MDPSNIITYCVNDNYERNDCHFKADGSALRSLSESMPVRARPGAPAGRTRLLLTQQVEVAFDVARGLQQQR